MTQTRNNMYNHNNMNNLCVFIDWETGKRTFEISTTWLEKSGKKDFVQRPEIP